MQRREPDSVLVAAARRGDRSAFSALLDRHQPSVRAVARRLLGDTESEDVVQEACLQAYLGLGRLRDPERFGAWLCAIAVNLAKMRLRSRRAIPVGTPVATAEDGVESAEIADVVRSALGVLPAREREAVLLYYVDGLSSVEVAALTGERPGTVRVRLHRARRRLREGLSELAPQPKEVTMVEVELDDVVVRMTDEKEIADEHLRIAVLKEKGGERMLPIWIGAPEGDALALGLGGEAMPRPMTADLMARLLEAVGTLVERVVVNSLREGTFFATVVLDNGSEVDARPSDALNLATRVGAVILVDDAVMEHAFTGDLADGLAEVEARLGADPDRPGEWRSLSPDLVKELRPPTGRR